MLGFLPRYEYTEGEISLKPGDRLVVYSDGVTEAMNSREEEFGEKSLQELIAANARLSSAELVDCIVGAVGRHAGDTPQSDDITVLVVTRRG